jgi:hypothetical protein
MNGLYSIAQDNNGKGASLRSILDMPDALYYSWSGYLAGEKYRHSLNRLLELIEQKNIRYILHDYRRIRVIHPSDQLWFKEKYVPRLNQSNLTHSFIVEPVDAKALDCIKHISAKINCLLQHHVSIYRKYNEALEALKAEALSK